MSDLMPRHCKTCTCTIGAVEQDHSHLMVHPPTIAAAGQPMPMAHVLVITAAAAPLAIHAPLPGAAGAMPPLTFERVTVRS